MKITTFIENSWKKNMDNIYDNIKENMEFKKIQRYVQESLEESSEHHIIDYKIIGLKEEKFKNADSR